MTWYAGANSTNNGSLGWVFEAAASSSISASVSEIASAADSISSLVVFASAVAESAAGAEGCVVAPIVSSDGDGFGRIKWKKPKTIKRSEFVHQQEYEAAVRAAMVQIPIIDDDDDDEIILMALTRILH